MSDEQPDPLDGSSEGQIITFYSYKGGTGRTMALANVAWILAANGNRVLVADWDLESPGLHRFFHPFLPEDEVRDASGVIDLIRQYLQSVDKPAGPDDEGRLISEHARVQPHALSVNWEYFPRGGSLEFLSAGRQNLDYAATLAGLDWDNFYENLNGGEFLDAVRADMKRHYDYVLIDSRTGLSDIAGICTIQLPDVLVDCFTLSIQGIDGAARIATLVAEREARNIRIFPVPMRVDQAEKDKVESGRAMAMQAFADLPTGMSQAERLDYWADVEVPYRAFYAYEETLAVFGDPPGSLVSLLASFERLTTYITNGAVSTLPPADELLRSRTKLLFTRKTALADDEVAVEFCAQDQVWGEWIGEVLSTAGIRTRERQLDESLRSDLEPGAGRTLTVVSGTYIAKYRGLPVKSEVPRLVVQVTTVRPPGEFYSASRALIAGVPELDAIDQLRKVIGPANWRAAGTPSVRRIRYPGTEPRINTAPIPNVRFTGRERDIRQLREMLSESGPAGVPPVVLEGLGGVGKTQVAMEYVHRFKTDYDVVWWLDCGQPQFIDASLADLGTRLRKLMAIAVPTSANAAEVAHLVIDLLAEGKEVPRWLLVFDNADDLDAVRPFLPEAGGDVLITSRIGDWTDYARTLPLDVFSRDESVDHLRKRVPSINDSEASQVAYMLGDFPLAVATAGAWLRETGTAASAYIRELERRAPQALALKHLQEYPKTVSEAWKLSLDRLAERSPAAARLFDLCSVMAPNIALELLYIPTMAGLLRTLDPQLADPMVVGNLIHEIDKLALIKLDLGSQQIRIHPLVQLVVRDRMDEDQRAEAEREMHKVLADARPSRGIDIQETWDRYRMLWPHLGYSRAEMSTEEPVRQLLIDRLRYLYLRHDLTQGRELGLSLEAEWQQMLASASDPDIIDSLRRQLLHLRSVQANILRELASFSEAMAIDESVLAEQHKLLGPAHPRTLATAGGLAADLRALGRYGNALELDKKTYAAWTERYGDTDPQSLRAANNLAVSYRLTGDISKALQLDEETLERFSNSLGPLNRQTLISAFNVARDLIEAGQYVEAAARMELFLAACIETHGADSVEAMNAEVLLGIALRQAGQPAAAERRFETALRLAARLGNSSSDALIARLAHAVNLIALGTFADAEREIQAVRAVYERRLGPAHPHMLVCLVDLACALRFEAPGTALTMARSAVSGLLDNLGGSHPYTLAAMMVTGALLADAGQLDQADETESRVMDRLTRVLGRDHPDTLRSRANLLITRKALGDVDAADELKRTIGDIAKVLGPDHPHVKELTAGRQLMHTLDQQPF
jgi:CO dehydrogenase nickel-insertion accessory protein CooC1/tetratricopeptide (TPR) repeat protein